MREIRALALLLIPTVASACGGVAIPRGDAAARAQTPNGAELAYRVTHSTIVITKGGTYSGTWVGDDPKTPAVQIATADHVTLRNCMIRAKADLIKATVANAHVTIQNCRGYGLDPMVKGQTNGNFFDAWHPGSVDVEHNYFEATAFGVALWGSGGWHPDGPLTVKYNKGVNLQGLASDGKGGRIVTHLPYGEDNGNHFVDFADFQQLKSAEVSWNEVDTAPSLASISDAITIWRASGTASTPILIHDNFIFGGYPANPTATLYDAAGITMDGTAKDTAATATAFVRIYNNQVIAHAGASISLTAGHDNEAYSNRVVSSGQYQNAKWYVGYTGIAVNDCTCYKQPPSVYYNNWATNNLSGVQFERPNKSGGFSPPVTVSGYWLPGCSGGSSGPGSKCTGNRDYGPVPITYADELKEIRLWKGKLAASGVTVGPVH